MRILLIDLAAIFYPAWHATADADGRAAFDRTIKRCRELQGEGWDRVAICVDAGDSGRSEKLPGYKANRPERPAPLLEQLRRCQEFLAKDGFHVLRGEGFEADDVIATVCAWAQTCEQITDVQIAGADKDLMQLVCGKVVFRKAANGEVLNSQAVADKFGVPPALIPDLLALVGDKADNIPGCPGVGEKTAPSLLQQFGTLEGVIAAADVNGNFTSSARRNILESQDICRNSRDLIRLRTDAPIDPAVILTEPVREEQTEPSAGPAEPEVVDPNGAEAAHVRSLATVDYTHELEPRSMGQAYRLAKGVLASRVFNGYGTPESAMLAIMAGREMGLPAVTSLRGFHVFENKLSLSAQLIVGIVLKSGLAEYFEPILDECDETRATWVTKRKGSKREQRITYTIEEARRAGLIKDRSNWEKRPKTMLRWRAAVELARAIFPDVVGNVYCEADWSVEEAA